VFWSLYTIDRLLAANLGRPLSLQEGDIDAERPLEGSDEELEAYCSNNVATPAKSPSVMTGFVALIDVHRIAGEVSPTPATSRASALIPSFYRRPNTSALMPSSTPTFLLRRRSVKRPTFSCEAKLLAARKSWPSELFPLHCNQCR
jgi:hypothetical protein